MTNMRQYRLCGGTFFTLLLQARKQRMGVREHYKGMSDGMADPMLLVGLAEITIPNYQMPTASMMQTIKSTTSRYKSCQSGSGTYFPFTDTATVASFDQRIKTQYTTSLSAMNDYVADFIDVQSGTKKDEYLVKALVEVIDADTTIPDAQLFYICEDGTTMTKANICQATSLCLQSFLLGVWHYIVINVQDNKVGKDTYNAWCPAPARSYDAALGENSPRVITLSYSKIQNDDGDSEDPLVLEAEIVEPEPSVDGGSTQQIVNTNPVFNTFNFNGPVGSFYNHVDQVVNNYGDKKHGE